jgi:vitamin B12 transporter
VLRASVESFGPQLPGLPSINRGGVNMTIRIGVRDHRRTCSVSLAVLVAACALVPAMTSAAGAQDATPLEGIVIYSANRTPTEASKVGSSVEVITEEEIKARAQTYVKDYLETLPGVHFSQAGPGGVSTISLRGTTGGYVKVLVDGIDISDPSNTVTSAHFEHLLVGDVARIEVLKGSQSGLYGGDAVGGVISIETKAARKLGFSQSGGAEYGAYNTWRGAYTAGYLASNGSNIALTVQGVNSDGFSAADIGREDDGYRNLTFSGRGEHYLSPSAKIFFAARSTRAKVDFDGGFPLNDTTDWSRYIQHAGRVGTEFKLLNGAFTNTLAIQGTRIERDIFAGFNSGWFEGERVKGEYRGVLRFSESLSLLAGADWEQTGARTNNTVGQNTADVSGAYAQLILEPITGLVFTAGGRIDDHSAFGSFDTHRLTGAYLIPGTETKIRGSRGTGFRAPSLDELYGAYPSLGLPNYGNPNLLPEESKSWDVGIEQGFLGGRFKLGATYFSIDTENLITFVSDPVTFECGAFCLVNAPGTTRREGVELTAAAKISSGITITAGYTYTDTERADGTRLVRVPRHALAVGLDLKPNDRVEANVIVRYVADTLDGFPVEPLDDYWLVNAKIAYEVSPGVKAYVRAENLLDEKYQTVLGFGTPGLSVYGGIQFALPDK